MTGYKVNYTFTFTLAADFASDNKEFLFITHTVEHSHISPSSTVGIQLHVSALYVGHLQVTIYLTQQRYEMRGVFFYSVGGFGRGERGKGDLVVSVVGTMT
jgi:hypothetical protein